ncbi:MAG: LPXTG cell wall anchor domain-containing protein [Firmicutes bacterium]|nr:LPXTG cell wall anchor domain-containing protein [Bacillota bacterium]
MLSAVVVFVVTYLLILPAISIDQDTVADLGGIELTEEKNSVAETVLKEVSDDYSVEVMCDNDAELPDAAFLQVEEIAIGTERYESYVKRSADAAGFEENRIEMARVFDIFISDPETGEHCQPADTVDVSIRLAQDLGEDDENVAVVHFEEDAELLESEVSDDTVRFETGSFSVYVVAKAGAPLSGEAYTGDPSDGISEGQFYISAKSQNPNKSEYYLMAETVTDGSLTMIRRTAANDITDAAVYRFVPVEGESGKYYLCSNGNYIRRTGGSSLGLTSERTQATKYTVTQTGNYYFIQDENGYYLNLKSKDAGAGFQASTATDSQMILTDALAGITDDPYGLDGKSFGIVYVNGSAGFAMTASFGADSVTVSTEENTIKVTKNSGDITLWTFEVAGGGKYCIKTNAGQYLKLTASGPSLVQDASEATALSVTPGTIGEVYEGRYRITVIDRNKIGTTAIRYNGNLFQADTTNANVQSGTNEWFYLAAPETMRVFVTLKKVGVDNTDPAQAEEPLPGAEFTVFTSDDGTEIARDSNNRELTNLISDEEGKFFSEYMDPGTYFLEETAVPAGYYPPPGRIKLEISSDSEPVISATWTTGEAGQALGTVADNTGGGYTVNIRNLTGIELPSTGGPGTTWVYLLGTVLLLGGSITLASRRRTHRA